MRDIITKLETKIADDLTSLDVNRMYDDMIDECYSFESVGGPFGHMLASKVLSECDPVAYRCGFNDWLDGEELVEINGEYYHQREAECIKDDLIDELKDELDDLQDQLDNMDEDDIDAGVNEVVEQQQFELEELIVKLRKHSF